ncbi:MAG: hypothetical protein RIA09_11755 [Hoeflea sp.]
MAAASFAIPVGIIVARRRYVVQGLPQGLHMKLFNPDLDMKSEG